jgi:hypothetical protein
VTVSEGPTPATGRTTSRRSKSLVLLVGALLGLATLIAWTQVWFTVSVADGARLDVAGQVAAPALSALALTSIVLVGALSIAGPFFRFVLGALESLIGVAIVFSAVVALGDPVHAASPTVSAATGVAGDASVRELVTGLAQTPWPWVALVSGALIIAAGIAIIVVGRRWPGSSRKYQAVRLEPADAGRTSVDDWDALSGGSDPTTRD